MNLTKTQTTASSAIKLHSRLQIIFLHLAPGAVITLVFVVLARVMAAYDLPASLALLVTWVIAGLPLLLGLLFYQGYRLNGRLSLHGILLYRQPLPWRQYVVLVSMLLVWATISSTAFYFLSESLHQSLFAWTPEWLNLSEFAQHPANYSRSVIWVIIILSAVLDLAVPITEELYFRSYLLPRLPFGRAWSPLINAVLFSLYHFWLPWDFFGRIVALLPVVYAVQWKQNVYLSILVHCLLNSLGTIGLLALVLK